MMASGATTLLGGVNSAGGQRSQVRGWADRQVLPAPLKVNSGAAGDASGPAPFYSHCHHQVRVLYYLWSHTATAHWLSPTSCQKFEPAKSICGKEHVILSRHCSWAASETQSYRKVGLWGEKGEYKGVWLIRMKTHEMFLPCVWRSWLWSYLIQWGSVIMHRQLRSPLGHQD